MVHCTFAWPANSDVVNRQLRCILRTALAQLVQVEAVERQAILIAEATQLDVVSVVQFLQALVVGREAQAIAAEAATADAQRDGWLVQLTSEELEGRLAITQAEHPAALQHQQQQLSLMQRLLEQHAQCLEVERQESVARLELAAEQWSGMALLAGRLPAVAGQLAEAQTAAQASREQIESLAEALEERELAISRLGRELEALRDAQTVLDAAGQQRELGRLEAERREAMLGEQRAAWSTLQEIERASHAKEMQQARMTPSTLSLSSIWKECFLLSLCGNAFWPQ
jgi:chromosome segregation ATPase